MSCDSNDDLKRSYDQFMASGDLCDEKLATFIQTLQKIQHERNEVAQGENMLTQVQTESRTTDNYSQLVYNEELHKIVYRDVDISLLKMVNTIGNYVATQEVFDISHLDKLFDETIVEDKINFTNLKEELEARNGTLELNLNWLKYAVELCNNIQIIMEESELNGMGELFFQQTLYAPFTNLVMSSVGTFSHMIEKKYAADQEVIFSLLCKKEGDEDKLCSLTMKADAAATLRVDKLDPFTILGIKPNSEYSGNNLRDFDKCALATATTAIALLKCGMDRPRIVLPFFIGQGYEASLFVTVIGDDDIPKFKVVFQDRNIRFAKWRFKIFVAYAFFLHEFRFYCNENVLENLGDKFAKAAEAKSRIFTAETKSQSGTNTTAETSKGRRPKKLEMDDSGNSHVTLEMFNGLFSDVKFMEFCIPRLFPTTKESSDENANYRSKQKSKFYFRAILASTNKPVFLKTWMASKARVGSIQKELRLLKVARDAGVSVAEPVTEDLIFTSDNCYGEHYVVLATEFINSSASDIADSDIRDFSTMLIQNIIKLHSIGILHCDIKPENIMWDSLCKKVKLIDFGHAQWETKAKKYLCTKKFMAPEIESGLKPHSRKSDCFSVGCTLLCVGGKYNDRIQEAAIGLCESLEVDRWSLEKALDVIQDGHMNASVVESPSPPDKKHTTDTNAIAFEPTIEREWTFHIQLPQCDDSNNNVKTFEQFNTTGSISSSSSSNVIGFKNYEQLLQSKPVTVPITIKTTTNATNIHRDTTATPSFPVPSATTATTTSIHSENHSSFSTDAYNFSTLPVVPQRLIDIYRTNGFIAFLQPSLSESCCRKLNEQLEEILRGRYNTGKQPDKVPRKLRNEYNGFKHKYDNNNQGNCEEKSHSQQTTPTCDKTTSSTIGEKKRNNDQHQQQQALEELDECENDSSDDRESNNVHHEQLDQRTSPLMNAKTSHSNKKQQITWVGPLGFSGNVENVKVLQIINANKCSMLYYHLVRDVGLSKVVAELGGWKNGARFVQDQIWAKPPGASPLTFHRDSPYFMFTPNDVITVWIALDDMSTDIGPIQYVRKSHLWSTKKRVGSSNHFFNPSGGYDLLLSAAKYEGIQSINELDIVTMSCLRQGCISIHNGLTWHGSGKNNSRTQPRRGIGLHYVPAHVTFTNEAKTSTVWKPYVSHVDDATKVPLTLEDFPIPYYIQNHQNQEF